MKFNPSQLLSTLGQPSTYAGFAGLATVAGLAADKYQAVAIAAATFFSLVAIALNEKPTINVGTSVATGETVATVTAAVPVSVPLSETPVV